jgi:hypothetical protein
VLDVFELLGVDGHRGAEPHEDADADEHQHGGQDGAQRVAVDLREHRHPGDRTHTSWDGELENQSVIDVAEPPVGDGRGDAGSDLGDVDRARHRRRTEAGPEQNARAGGPEAHPERAINQRGAKPREGNQQEFIHRQMAS